MPNLNQQQRKFLLLFILLTSATLRFINLADTPPGVHYDEAANGILAAEIGWDNYRPLFISSYTGKETFFFYIAGGLMRLIGPYTFTLRLTAAYLGLLTTALTYWLTLELFPRHQHRRLIALLTTLLLATSFWHLLFSHLGFRAISQPFTQAFTLAALLRGLRHNDRRWLTAGGLALGLTAHTYLAARLFPLPLALLLLAFLTFPTPHTRRQIFTNITLFLTTATAPLAPLLYYFYHHPDAFWTRISQVGPTTSNSFLDNYLTSLAMLWPQGDPYWRFNIPNQPIFTFPLAFCALLGLLHLLRAYRHHHQPTQFPHPFTTLFLLANTLIMLLPTALASNEILPSNLRAIGLLPFIYIFPALGLTHLLGLILPLLADLGRIATIPNYSRGPGQPLPPTPRQLLPYTLIILLFTLTSYTARAYHHDWANRTDLFYESDADLTALAAYLDDHPPNGELYITALHDKHPTFAFLSDYYGQTNWLPGTGATLVIPPTGPATYAYPHSAPPPDWLTSHLQPSQTITSHLGPDGQPAFSLFIQPQPPAYTIPNIQVVNLGNIVFLEGHAFTPPATSQDPLTVRLYWRIAQTLNNNLLTFIHLEDEWGHRWSQVETAVFPTPHWQVGQRVVHDLTIPLPPGLPQGSYTLRFGFFDPDNGNRLSVLDREGRFAGSSYPLLTTYLPARPMPATMPVPPYPLNQPARPNLMLLGYGRGGSQIANGASYPLSLWWQADSTQQPALIRFELMPPGNRPGRILLNTHPVHDTLPFAALTTPQFFIDHHNIPIPLNIPAGDYNLQLRLLAADNSTLTTANLGPLTILNLERQFTPPADAIRFPATFSDEIALHGYTLTPHDDNHLTLNLIWHSLRPATHDYTVFVHLLNPDGTCCFWQQDIMPQQNNYPTTLWLPDEYITDTYIIP
ncbi:MAG TPA: hypothetical protein VLL52_10010, partial [Anaerolineae bacterium]|nr:hypothetical protein [Anaerolineae bacterium]